MARTSLFRIAMVGFRVQQRLVFRVPPDCLVLRQRMKTAWGEESRNFKALQLLLMRTAVSQQELATILTSQALMNHCVNSPLVFPKSDEALFVIVEALIMHDACLTPCSALCRCPQKMVNRLDHILFRILNQFELADIGPNLLGSNRVIRKLKRPSDCRENLTEVDSR